MPKKKKTIWGATILWQEGDRYLAWDKDNKEITFQHKPGHMMLYRIPFFQKLAEESDAQDNP